MAGLGTFLPSQPRRAMSASLIGHSGSSAFRLSTTTVSMSLTGSCFSSESSPGALPSWDSRTRWNNLSGALTGAEPSGLGGHPAGGSRPKRKVPLRCRLCRNERFRRSGASFWWAQVRPEAPIRLIARRGAGVVAFDLAPLVFEQRCRARANIHESRPTVESMALLLESGQMQHRERRDGGAWVDTTGDRLAPENDWHVRGLIRKLRAEHGG